MDMLSRFSTVFQSAVDALAPPVPLLEDLIYHWKMTMKFFVRKNADTKCPIEETNIPAHVEQMLKILLEEESTLEAGSTGPSMEYFLQNRLLDTLNTLARADCPPGMKSIVLHFFTQLLNLSRQALLPHVNVYTPVQKMCRLCGEVQASPTELEEVDFIMSVCTKLNEDPYLVNFFIEIPTIKCSKSDKVPTVVSASQFALIDALLSLLTSADKRVSSKSFSGLVLCLSLPEDGCAVQCVQSTRLCSTITDILLNLFHMIPRDIDPNDLEEVSIAGDGRDMLREDTFPGKRQVISYLLWWQKCDYLCKESHPIVCEALASSIQHTFLHCVLETDIYQTAHAAVVLTTAHITKCFRQITAPILLTAFIHWLVGDNREPELPSVVTHSLKRHLLDNCCSENDEVALETLRMFEILLEHPCPGLVESVVLCNVVGRGYYDNSCVDSHISSWSDEEDEREKIRNYEELDISPGSSPVSRTLAPSSIHKIINCFLLVIPEELQSTEEMEGTGYDNYLQDANSQYRSLIQLCATFNWPREAICPENASEASSSDSRPEADFNHSFYEGSFLKMLFDRMEKMLQQPYEINLELTSLLAKLALLPHPHLHEYLLNPLIPTVAGARTLFCVLEKLVCQVQVNIANIPDFRRKLCLTRLQLLGDPNETVPLTSPEPDSGLLEGLIVLEEFCKELAAITFVKYQHNSSL